MDVVRTPNAGFIALVEETGWTYSQLARRVNSLGTRRGLVLKYDDSAVAHWLNDGTVPRAKVRPLILEVLSRQLGRPVTAAQAGLGPTGDAPGSGTATLASGLIDLGSADLDPSRRTLLAAGLYSAVLVIPGWQDHMGRFELLRTNPRLRIGQPEVDSVIAMTEHISDLDDQFGGRMARPLASAFLVTTVAPYLEAEASEPVRRAMLSAAADHCYLNGYMAMDERADGLAQQYYVKALELAKTAGDHLTYCTTLRGMSVQAVDLGHGQQALRLADAAASASRQAGPRMLAFLAGQQAHAAAQTGDRAGALVRMKEAESAMEKAESRATAFGSYDPSSLNYHVGQVRYELGDLTGAIDSFEESDRLRELVYRRTRVRYNAILAEKQLQAGRLDEACVNWHRVLDDYPHVQSGRCDDRFAVMIGSIRPYLRNSTARALYERARPMVRKVARF